MQQRTRDQQRARHAYDRVRAVWREGTPASRTDYRIAVNGLGATVIHFGLAGTMAWLERSANSESKKWAVARLLNDLAGAGIAAVPANTAGEALPERVRNLSVHDYMLATRDFLRLVIWFRRAVQATAVEEPAARAGQS